MRPILRWDLPMRRGDRVRGGNPRGVRAARGPIVVMACVLVTGGCTGPPEGVVRTSGALADGFEIEPGSGLVGAVFPTPSFDGGGHQAVLRVDGDMERVFEAYVGQAEDLGYPMESARPQGRWCGEAGGRFPEDPLDPYELECTASSYELDRWRVSLRALVNPDGQDYIHLRTAEYPADASEPSSPAGEGPVASATDVEVAPDLTPAGDPPLLVVEGSALISEPFPAQCLTGGYVAVLRVTGELAPVLRRYDEQFLDVISSSEGLVVDGDEAVVAAAEAGGGEYSAVAVAGDPSYVLIERCNG